MRERRSWLNDGFLFGRVHVQLDQCRRHVCTEAWISFLAAFERERHGGWDIESTVAFSAQVTGLPQS
jgi:hypothetical protein